MTGYYNTFVVKIWCDEAVANTRGYIQHVSSQERVYFVNLEDVMDFMHSRLSPPPNGSGAQDRWSVLTEEFGDAG